jgi:hypothetical protein
VQNITDTLYTVVLRCTNNKLINTVKWTCVKVPSECCFQLCLFITRLTIKNYDSSTEYTFLETQKIGICSVKRVLICVHKLPAVFRYNVTTQYLNNDVLQHLFSHPTLLPEQLHFTVQHRSI